MKPVAWLHEVVQDDGEADQALSFSQDSFPLQGVGGFKSLSARPLFTASPEEIMLAYENLLADQEKLRGALRTVQFLRQLGGMMPGTHEVVMLAVKAADEALGQGADDHVQPRVKKSSGMRSCGWGIAGRCCRYYRRWTR